MIELPRLAPRLVERKLENGLRLVLLPDQSDSLVAVNLWYHVGSKNDPPGRSGLAHLFEHMLFQGSQNVAANEHFQLVQRAGGSTNASTSFDRTNYYETLPSHCLELGLWLESDRLGFLLPALTEEKFEGQRSVVKNERRQRIDNQPYGQAFEMVHGALYATAHPYSWPVIGFLEDIQAADLVDVAEFFRQFYSPANAVLTLVGDLETEATVDLVERYFAEIPPTDPPSRVTAKPPTAGGAPRQDLLLEDDVALERIYLAWSAPPLTDPLRYAGEMLAVTLSGGKSSPLYQDLVHQRQLAQDASAYLLPMELSSTFLLVATARPGSSLDEIEERLRHHLLAAAKTAPRREDLERARNQVVTGVFEELQSVGTLADLLSRSATFFGDPAQVDDEVRSYLGVKETDITDFARTFLHPDRGVRLRVVPRAQETRNR